MNAQSSPLTIGVVARRVGVAIDTIRYYEREGLLPEPARRASGYRSYGEGAVTQLRFIRRAKELGFTLEEIRELLAL
jgi:MerR family copper efflux transcriptional regulator